ncbi:MAG: glutamate--cysteine ligase [Chlamydiia bacterium]|nr:glutamate--cysteine ligase [Chlamydiia bacterium]
MEQSEDTMSKPKLHLFEAVGIELEYMIVDSESLDVKPITDSLIHTIAGTYITEVNCGRISYSNELALHVVELKTTNPERALNGLENEFQSHIRRINELLAPLHAKLMPTAAHPWMNPDKEMKLWCHEHNPIYEAYNRIFDCRGHGWSNLQSTHINLPFADDAEFYKLHSACRALLPLMPALAASSPILGGKFSSKMDKRLDVYRYNQKRIPSITGQVIPEVSYSKEHYEKEILQPIYQDIAPFDPEGILQEEWLNSKGAIARFDRMAIEIRVLDIQECPQADIAIAKAIQYVLKMLIDQGIKDVSQDVLVQQFFACVDDAEDALVESPEYLALFGLTKPLRAGQLWRYLLGDLLKHEEIEPLELILREGTLARRILRAWNQDNSRLKTVYGELADCLAEGRLFCLRL